ncbi:MAG: Succinyl-CoA synthetase, beta subunit [Parcubacteria group bacterium GW2011_GWA2_47_26]|nr:MAG: Succinyl-CoA synthetase, beta subunit [Parcubacteria group bacterium GW2011_GWA2_47_26]
MNLYEFEGKNLFAKYGITIPKGVCVYRGEDPVQRYRELGLSELVVKAQVLSGKRGKNAGIRFCSSRDEVENSVRALLNMDLQGQYVAAVRLEERMDILEEHYLSIVYDTKIKQPVLIYSREGGVDIEEVGEDKIFKQLLDIRLPIVTCKATQPYSAMDGSLRHFAPCDDILWSTIQNCWNCFLQEDARLVEINPLVKTREGRWIAVDAKVALDDDAGFRHPEWKGYAPRTMLGRRPTDREVNAKKIDEGEAWYRGTAGKYIEMDGDIAVLFSGGGASLANMDALYRAGLRPANYTEYSGNPPREKVYALTKVVLSKPGLKGLWIAGGVANFTNVKETFQGIADALDEVRPKFPIVVRRAGPYEKEGMALMEECMRRNEFEMKLFGKETSMSETAEVLAAIVKQGAN